MPDTRQRVRAGELGVLPGRGSGEDRKAGGWGGARQAEVSEDWGMDGQGSEA